MKERTTKAKGIRLDKPLWAEIERAAALQGVSVNEFCRWWLDFGSWEVCREHDAPKAGA